LVDKCQKFETTFFVVVFQSNIYVYQPFCRNVKFFHWQCEIFAPSQLPLNKRLFALWEGGSAYEINPKTLATIGIQSWSPQTKGLPFGAHYQI
jgi:hypothetical protein